MGVDRRGMNHRPAGLPAGYAGTYAPSGGPAAAADVTPPAAPPAGRPARRGVRSHGDDVRAWEAKDRIERLAAEGRAAEAEDAARAVGALTRADRIPYADGGVAALFDGRELTTVEIHGPEVVDVGFRPETIRA